MLRTCSDMNLLLPAFGSIRREFERALDGMANATSTGHGLCPISIWQDDEGVYLHADVPGVRLEDLDLQFDDGRLFIRGERKSPVDGVEFEHNERVFGKFERSVTLSDVVDPSTIDASLDDGRLLITFSKVPEAQPQAITIRQGAQTRTDESGEA